MNYTNYEDGTQSFPKHPHIKYRRRETIQKKEYNIRNVAKFRNQKNYRIFSNLIRIRFYSFRGLKNEMGIRIACGLNSRSRAGFWKKMIEPLFVP